MAFSATVMKELQDEFAKYSNASGSVSSDDSVKALRSVGVQLTDDEFGDIVTDFDCDHDGACTFAQFLELCSKHLAQAAVSEVDTDFSPEQLALFNSCFKVYDENKDGKLNNMDAVKCLRALGICLSDTQCKDVTAQVNAFPGRLANFKQFVNLYRRYKDVPVPSAASLQAAFAAINKGPKRGVSAKELARIMGLGGEALSADEIKDFIDIADSNRDGNVDEREFIKLLDVALRPLNESAPLGKPTRAQVSTK